MGGVSSRETWVSASNQSVLIGVNLRLNLPNPHQLSTRPKAAEGCRSPNASRLPFRPLSSQLPPWWGDAPRSRPCVHSPRGISPRRVRLGETSPSPFPLRVLRVLRGRQSPPGPGDNKESRPVSPPLTSKRRSARLRPPTGDDPAVHPYPPPVGRRSAEPSVRALPRAISPRRERLGGTSPHHASRFPLPASRFPLPAYLSALSSQLSALPPAWTTLR